jgi:LacI family transcriptional regulator
MRLMEAQLERLLQEGVDGLLLAGSTPAPRQIERFIAAGIPIGPDVSSPSRIRDTGEAVRAAALAAFRALTAEGHRRIAYLMRVERDEGYASRLQRARVAWLEEALREVDVALDRQLVIPLGRVEASDQCEAAVLALLHRTEPPTAIVAGVSLLTLPLLRALRAGGRRIPADVSVLAFDESGWEELHEPPISVVRHDYFAVAAATTEELVARIEGRTPPGPDPLGYRDRFVHRASIGPVPR